MSRSRYRGDGALPDYSHRLHAGNVGDVWKHAALVEVLRRVATSGSRVVYVETHAGEGRYALGPTGEWTEGIGRVWHGTDESVGAYLAVCRRLAGGGTRPSAYPGSPAFAQALLPPDAGLELWERDGDAASTLAAHTRGDARVRVTRGDGLGALASTLRAAARADGVLVFVDPPWSAKSDWVAVPDALARATHAHAGASFMLWYPVKSLTRPNAMIHRLAAADVAGTIAELVTTPLDQRRNRLNGSGVLLVRPPTGALAAIAAMAPALGHRLATTANVWSFRLQSWPASS